MGWATTIPIFRHPRGKWQWSLAAVYNKLLFGPWDIDSRSAFIGGRERRSTVVKPTYSESRRSLEKWRRKKDKVLEVDPVERPVESVYSTEDPPGGYKRPPAIPRVFPTMGESSGDLTYLPIQAPSPKGEPTMVPIRAPSPKGEATMIPGESRGPSADRPFACDALRALRRARERASLR